MIRRGTGIVLAAVLLGGAGPARPEENAVFVGKASVQTETVDIDRLLREFREVRYGGWGDFAPAFRALGDPAIDAVLPWLRRPESGEGADYRIEWNQRRVAWVLGVVGSARAIGWLIDMLEDGALHSAGRGDAARALGRLKSERAVDPLLLALADREIPSSLRRAAALALRDMRCERAVPALLEALSDREMQVRMGAIMALGRIGTPEAVAGLETTLGDPDGYLRSMSYDALIALQPRRKLDLLVQALADRDYGVRENAVGKLVKMGESVCPRMLGALENPRESVRREAIRILGRLKTESAIEGLAKAIQDPGWMVRNQAAVALARLGTPKTVEALIALLNSENPEVRTDAAWALGELRAKAALQPLIKEVPARDSGWMAALALGRIGAREAVPALARALESGDRRLRRAAARSLALIPCGSSRSALSTVRQDKDPEVRLWADLAFE